MTHATGDSYIFSSESVSEGHPDKLADRISDEILDLHLSRDPRARVACEVLVTRNLVCVAGETRARQPVERGEIEQVVRRVLHDVGYDGFDARFGEPTVKINVILQPQASEIGNAVDGKAHEREQGAGDQGLMFGYASNETPSLMPAPITYAHAIVHELARRRKSGEVPWLRPDAKSQVTVRYRDCQPVEVTRLVVSTQHTEDVKQRQIRDYVIDEVFPGVIPETLLHRGWQDSALVNPSGSFTEGGPATDTGLTGRKIIVDTYGGAARHGGGAFSGKDPSKVDRSAAYAARWVAKNVVAAGLADRCEIQLAYAIGEAKPVSLMAETFGTGKLPRAVLEARLAEAFDLTPYGIITGLDLLRPIYAPTAAYGHFGRPAGESGSFSWEDVSRAEALLSGDGMLSAAAG
ncbi:MAG TPA: methionine adenosyltransferase [Gemmatimonadaceae bacterium]|nr:methionine adenosyltransferase [Gemmatimonadaceae bacterium]